MFIHVNDNIVNSDTIDHVSCSRLLEHGWVRIHYKNENTECVYGPEAIDLIMRLCPNYLEGKRMKYIKNAWTIHNLVGHPLMQLLSWFKLNKWAIKIHDITIPKPKKSFSKEQHQRLINDIG